MFQWLLALLVACRQGDEPTDTDVADTAPSAAFRIDPCDAEFGPISVGEVASQTVQIFNDGDGALDVLSLTTTGPFNLTAAAVKVGPGSQYQFSVRFNPTAWGEFAADFVVETNVGTRTCVLVGHTPADLDGDGHDQVAAAGDDCDETDASIHGGATEVWYDGTDQDCSGGSDFDQDSDGYESKVFNADAATGGGDCQDVNPAIHPGAVDNPYDGVDANCDGANDFDPDGDGYDFDDCDETDASVHPGAADPVGDGVDSDCDGVDG